MCHGSPPQAGRTPCRHTNTQNPASVHLLAADSRWCHFYFLNFVHRGKNRVCLRKQTNHWKLYPAFGPLEFVAIDILGLLPKCLCDFQNINVILDRLINLVQMILLRRIRSMNVSQAFLKLWVYKYGPQIATLRKRKTVHRKILPVCMFVAQNC